MTGRARRSALDRLAVLVGRGDYLRAYDEALVLEDQPLSRADRARVEHLRVLALARSGARDQAAAAVASLEAGPELTPQLREDIAALRARIAKDRALEEGSSAGLIAAAEQYEAIHRTLGRPYACINAATLWFIAGDVERARSLAAIAAAAAAADLAVAAGPDDRYWALATGAEAALIRGDLDRARDLLARAGDVPGERAGARATTRRQLALLLDKLRLDAAAELAPLENPTVVQYCGHRVAVAQSDAFEAAVASGVARAVATLRGRRGIGAAYGSLACGADLVLAEALLGAGAELHVVLPFAAAEFVDVSVRSGGDGWVARFERCLAQATSVTVTCDSAYLGDDTLFAYASRVAMGTALNRARLLDASAAQIAIWDGEPAVSTGGTAHDVAVWRSAGAASIVIPARAERTSTGRSPGALERPVTAVLFGDIQGFSRLRDEEMMRFLPAALGAVARAVAAYRPTVLARNTWGDAVFLAISNVADAARCALDIQAEIAAVDLGAAGLPTDLTLRLAAHVGPVLRLADPLREVDWVFGRELTRAARIEPRTPPGQVYVTAAFAALLALEPGSDVVPEYVGTITTAKGFETIPMYVLRDCRPAARGRR